MLKSLSKLRASAAATAALAAVAVAAPQAMAAEKPAAAAVANVCGAGYHQTDAWALHTPTDRDKTVATLYAYENGDKGCAILGNNQGSKQYMSLSLCKSDGTHCDTDSGMFSEYAGPVHVADKFCATVSVKMGQSSSSLYLEVKNNPHLFLCD
ncbi:hypothetical protein AQI88_34525 [Streptomyces cellostaticus]|uniref:Spore-associated protein A n=1 Tax=Streptomyces cellostaticus TaxID=67285 RepID=A0A101NF07_9ACTN|nr:hypothetical protein [Streptomyces cellostaticus]KUM91905.1 hypothetical protein AQI88_34525 [Streptomyces cellostaticus]GHI06943.1 hypothetical protein Scel_52640 [Streptomyces cellostaticus]